MESPNLVASCADGLDDTLPRFTGVQSDSVWATHVVSVEAYAWKMTPHLELLPLVLPLWPTCVLLLGLYPCKVDY
jgi:hypothetical protein